MLHFQDLCMSETYLKENACSAERITGYGRKHAFMYLYFLLFAVIGALPFLMKDDCCISGPALRSNIVRFLRVEIDPYNGLCATLAKL